jgi:hypothetical protein
MGASCPVIIVPAGATAKVLPKRIVLAIDSQGDLNRPVATTIKLARALKAGVEVWSGTRPGRGMRRRDARVSRG